MINSYKSALKQLNIINRYMESNTISLFINAELYTSLMDIRDRLKNEIAKFQLTVNRQNSKYAKELRKRQRN